MRVRRIIARQPAQNRDEPHRARVKARHLPDRRRQRPAMTQPDDPVCAPLDLAAQKACASQAQGAQGHAVLAQVGGNLAVVQPIARAQLILQHGAFDDLSVDGDLDHALGHGAGDQAVRLDAG